ncbi:MULTISPECIES: ATP-binding cassette domain-containing protein [unclassified Gilliamella]|uniref:ATP-binding cassette domain-containing protein n=1 Tax=unclassified Gilliamella TaxID=2685620 RepID=UPI00226ACBF6|nr:MULTISPECIES: ATP-binding cassette domain-containing protein [unclassified Gilliamella]MCX8575245.1 ABC transporter ATP-binding protein [Gilliamella sp. B3831]MCX8577224.1 ABC transporter ATP-binding protein [Gilliamella sp. B3815]MCX8590149.1 ABC transporter ATP-binding protein [Gilliamella sp. B3812]MCX8604578.1 ABC transporter ATP-binding protein [Gilliamella sp. B3823]MCX8604923.1 ABC transporter ATP-binding protein [Gilliamella sp. B3825]
MTKQNRQQIKLTHVTKVFKQKNQQVTVALKPLSTTIFAQGVTGLVGPDGAGKTTLLRMLAGLLSPSAGQINVAQYNPTEDRDQLRAILGYMPQKFGLYEDLTVIENLNLFADLRHIKQEERQQIFAKLLKFTDLTKFTQRLAGKLSGGMKQKLGLACTLLGDPQILLLDEPGVGVDPISRQELWHMVHQLAKEGMLIIWSTSYLDEAEQCETILLMNQGELLFQGQPSCLTERVKDRVYLLTSPISHRRLLQTALKLPEVSDGVIEGDRIRLILKPNHAIEQVIAKLGTLNITYQPTLGRFEDAFIDRLGGITQKESILTKIMPQVAGLLNDIVIEAKDLTRTFGHFIATDHVNFAIKRGEIFGLLGPNGAGKSTTFKMMCGLLPISSGQALVLGFDLKKSVTQVRERIGYMAQRFSLYDKLTVRQNLNFFSGIYGLMGSEQTLRMDEMITAFNFEPILDKTPESLPLGFKQRLALACALMHKPDIVFLDEPTSGVDPITRREFWIHINSLVEKGVTVMVTTHFMDEAEYCDRIALINGGKLIALGSPNQLKQSVASNATMEQAFIKLVNDANSGATK